MWICSTCQETTSLDNFAIHPTQSGCGCNFSSMQNSGVCSPHGCTYSDACPHAQRHVCSARAHNTDTRTHTERARAERERGGINTLKHTHAHTPARARTHARGRRQACTHAHTLPAGAADSGHLHPHPRIHPHGGCGGPPRKGPRPCPRRPPAATVGAGDARCRSGPGGFTGVLCPAPLWWGLGGSLSPTRMMGNKNDGIIVIFSRLF